MIPFPNQIPSEFLTNFFAISNETDDQMKTESSSEQDSFQDYESSNSKPSLPDYQSTMQMFPAPLIYNYQTKTWNSFYDNVIYKGFS